MSNRPGNVPTIQQLRESKIRLEKMLIEAETLGSKKSYKRLSSEARTFIDACERVIEWGISEEKQGKPYTQRTVTILEDWIDFWTDISASVIKDRLSVKSRLTSFLSVIGRYVWYHERRKYSED